LALLSQLIKNKQLQVFQHRYPINFKALIRLLTLCSTNLKANANSLDIHQVIGDSLRDVALS